MFRAKLQEHKLREGVTEIIPPSFFKLPGGFAAFKSLFEYSCVLHQEKISGLVFFRQEFNFFKPLNCNYMNYIGSFIFIG